MKIPEYIACIGEYYDNEATKEVVMRSIAIVESKSNKLVVSRYCDLSDYTDDDDINNMLSVRASEVADQIKLV